jgi:hypothetical protein
VFSFREWVQLLFQAEFCSESARRKSGLLEREKRNDQAVGSGRKLQQKILFRL